MPNITIGVPIQIGVDERVLYFVGLLVFSILSVKLLIALKK